MAGFLITVSILVLIYFAIGVGAEVANRIGRGDSIKFNKETLIRIIKWPKEVFGK